MTQPLFAVRGLKAFYGNIQALKGIDLDVKPGEMIGLVGRSGAGKSTTVNLLCRFYEADSGMVRIDDIDITRIDLRSVRRHIGIVLQAAVANAVIFYRTPPLSSRLDVGDSLYHPTPEGDLHYRLRHCSI